MTAICFVDTNILVYACDPGNPRKQSLARDWVHHLWKKQAGRISTQVLKEYYQVVTRKLEPGLAPEKARADIRELYTWQPVDIDLEVLELAWALEDQANYSWWDILILAAAQRAKCQYLLSEDLQSGHAINNLTIINPFTQSVNEVM